MSKPTIYIVDDEPAVCHALSELLAVLGYEVRAFKAAAELLAALDAGAGPGCLVSDVRMPGMDGLALMQELGRRGSRLPVVLVSGHADVPMAVAAIKAGAEDFIEKPIDDVQLVAAINRCLARTFDEIATQRAGVELERRFQALTPRETEVFDLVARGHTSNAIGLHLGISPRTVETYRKEIMEKMQAESVAVIVRQAIRLGRMSA